MSHPQKSPIPIGHAEDLNARIEKLNAIGIALSAEKDTTRLLEKILVEAIGLTHSDGGTLYLVTENQELKFEILRSNSLRLALGGSCQPQANLSNIALRDSQGTPNDSMVAAYCVNHREIVNIANAYEARGFDFSGTRRFDAAMQYKSVSFLTVPLQNYDGEIIGVLQLINKIGTGGEVTVFSTEDQELCESLASQAAVALTNARLLEDLKNLFEAFIKMIARAIDEKSPYTGKHCKKVPVITMMLAEAASCVDHGPLRDFQLSGEDRYALEVASWLHDCGKVTTPEYVVDKATKLETLFDRIELVDTRFEVLKRDAEIRKLRQLNQLQSLNKLNPLIADQLETQYLQELQQLHEEREFLREANIGAEFMTELDQQRVRDIAKRRWQDADGDDMPFLSYEEVYNLTIAKGTLTPEERDVIQHHIAVTQKMLASLPFPKHLRNVPEYAGGHHERVDGKGYPLGLHGEQMSVPARTMAIADIFEALTAQDRPYKDAKKLSEALLILGLMKLEGHIDPHLFDVFIEKKVYLQYARQYLSPAQIDIEEPEQIPGYPFQL